VNIQEPENLKYMAHIVDGTVVSVSVWDGVAEWTPAEEVVEIPEDSHAGIGWDWDGKKFVDNRPVENPFGVVDETQ
jgi:hypothetical protein